MNYNLPLLKFDQESQITAFYNLEMEKTEFYKPCYLRIVGSHASQKVSG